MRADRLVAIGASAGGVEALKRLLGGLPVGIPAAFCIVLHMLPLTKSLLPAILSSVSTLPVRDVVSGEHINGGTVYVAPPNRDFVLEDSRAVLNFGPKVNRNRPAIDPLFSSAAAAYGRNAIGVVLTGMLDDGTAGLWEIKRRGGIAVVQSPEDAEFPEMPMSAIANVDVDYRVALKDMPELLALLCNGVQK